MNNHATEIVIKLLSEKTPFSRPCNKYLSKFLVKTHENQYMCNPQFPQPGFELGSPFWKANNLPCCNKS